MLFAFLYIRRSSYSTKYNDDDDDKGWGLCCTSGHCHFWSILTSTKERTELDLHLLCFFICPPFALMLCIGSTCQWCNHDVDFKCQSFQENPRMVQVHSSIMWVYNEYYFNKGVYFQSRLSTVSFFFSLWLWKKSSKVHKFPFSLQRLTHFFQLCAKGITDQGCCWVWNLNLKWDLWVDYTENFRF